MYKSVFCKSKIKYLAMETVFTAKTYFSTEIFLLEL